MRTSFFWTIMLCALLSAQSQDTQTPTFTTSTEFVQVPVIVQRGGKHVGGLSKESFVLRQDGKDQPIVSFEEIHRGPKPPAGETATAEVHDPVRPAPKPITIIALDLVNTPNLDRAYFAEEFQRYLLGSHNFGGPIGLVAIENTGVRVIKEFTNDPQQLLAAYRKEIRKPQTSNNNPSTITREVSDAAISQSETQLSGQGTPINLHDALVVRSADENMTRFQDRNARINSQQAIQQLAQALKGIPGRKSVLLVGSGFKFIDSDAVSKMISGNELGRQLDAKYVGENVGQAMDQAAYTWKLLNDANIAVYPIDTRRTYNSAAAAMDVSVVNTPSNATQESYRSADRDVLDTFKSIAAATGGKPCFYRTDLDNCVREAVDDDQDYYLLGFYADKNNRKTGWHKIEVKLSEKGNIRYRQGFFIASFNPEQQRKTDIGLALSSPFAYTSLDFGSQFEPFASGGKQPAVFHILIPPGGITTDSKSGQVDFDVIAVARGDGGKDAAHFNQRVNRKFPPEAIAEINKIGIDYKNKLDLPAGDYAVWFVVRDNLGGRTGSSVVRLKVP